MRVVVLSPLLVVAALIAAPLFAAAQTAASCDSYLLSTASASPSTVLTVASINGILTEHNNARRTVSPAAAVMPMLTWNQTLANFAQEYMDTCVGIVHSSSAMRSNSARFGYSYIGENLAAGSSSSYGAANGGRISTAAWNGERPDWTYPMTCASGAVCGHYTQVIWANTREVGCGYTYCASQPYRNYWSCVYGPGGNYGGQNPYVQATATTTAACQVSAGSTLTPAPPVGAATTPAPTTTAAGPTTTLAPGATSAPTPVPTPAPTPVPTPPPPPPQQPQAPRSWMVAPAARPVPPTLIVLLVAVTSCWLRV